MQCQGTLKAHIENSDGRVHQQAPLVRPWASPSQAAELALQEVACKRGYSAAKEAEDLFSKFLSLSHNLLYAVQLLQCSAASASAGGSAGCACLAEKTLLGPGHSAEEFRRRAGLWSRSRKSCARVLKGY